MAKIKQIFAYEIIDSRGYPTVEGRLQLDSGVEVTTSVPAGTSVGKYETPEVRDGDAHRFDGMGVSKAVQNINNLIAQHLVGLSPLQQKEIDEWLFQANVANNNKIGANAILTVSQLIVKAAAADLKIPLFNYINQLYKTLFNSQITIEKIPTPIFNIINGGKHANNNLEFQEFQIIPSSSFAFSKSYQIGVETFHELKKVLEYRNANISVGEEGGFAPNLSTNTDAFEVINETIGRKNLHLGLDIFLGVDMASSHFYKGKKYFVRSRPDPMNTEQYIEFLMELIKQYIFLLVEDPLDQDDFEAWAKLNQILPKTVYLVGDDLLATNKDRLSKAIDTKACTTILVKPNQIGTISKTLEVIDVARKNNFNYVVSHRSGETNDSFIADFAVGVQSDFVKFGAPSRGERVAKYNRLWQIEREELKI